VPPLDADRRVAQFLEAWRDGMSASDATLAAADAIEATYRAAGMPVRIRDLDLLRKDFPRIADERHQQSVDLLEAAW
jgi:alcohol dehydrogenase class IV